MTTKNLSQELNLDGLAFRLPCDTGRDECTCGGCRAASALRLADEHLDRGELLDALVKAQHAAYAHPHDEVRNAVARLYHAWQGGAS